jgi:hypothetical protein
MQNKLLKALLLTSLSCVLGSMPAHAGNKASSKTKPAPTEAKAMTVTYELVGMADFRYSSYLMPWDEKQHPVFYALLGSPERYNQYFHPAYLMNNNKPAGPSAETFANTDVLVVARHVTPGTNKELLFSVDRLVAKNNRLELHYRYTPPQTPGTYTMTDGLMLQLPKQAYDAVDLFENEVKIGTLQLKLGQTSMDTTAPIIAVPPKH